LIGKNLRLANGSLLTRVESESWRYEQAIADFSKAIELEPDKPLPSQNRAACHCELGNWSGAADDLARAVARGAEGHRPWYELALCRAAAENAEGYREACARAMTPGKAKMKTGASLSATANIVPHRA